MSSDRLGVDADLRIRASSGGPNVVLTSDGQSASNISLSEVPDSQPAVGERGVGGEQLGEYKLELLSVGAMPYGPNTKNIMRNPVAKRLWFDYDEQGTGSGLERRSGQAVIATYTRTYHRVGGGGIVHTFTAPTDGEIRDSTQ